MIFLLAFCIVLYTGRGNIYELIWVFTLNILGNLYMLLMQDSFNDEEFQSGALFLLIWNSLYLFLAIYSFFINGETQYLLWQIWFQLAGIRTYLFFQFSKDIKFLDYKFMSILSIALILIWYTYLDISGYALVQSIWFALTIIWMSEVRDIRRYLLIFLWAIIVTWSSFFWLYVNYLAGNIFGITISFSILSLSTSIFYTKLIPSYILKIKKL